MSTTTTSFGQLFKQFKPIIGCIHLKPLPGSPLYNGMHPVYEHALAECQMYVENGIDALIIENFHDRPFYPDNVPAETIAAMSAIGRELRKICPKPLGINVLRNDAKAALAIACAMEAEFIRVNVHMHAVICDQGIVVGKGYETMRLKKLLQSDIQVWADVAVKHASPLGNLSLVHETEDLCARGLVDAVIVSGSATGVATDVDDLKTVQMASTVPVLIGSGVTPESLSSLYPFCNGFIVGSYFKKHGVASNELEAQRIATMMSAARNCG